MTQEETQEDENLCNVSGYFRTKEDKEKHDFKNKEDDSFFNTEDPEKARSSEELKENVETMDFNQDDIDSSIDKRQGEPQVKEPTDNEKLFTHLK
jgi:hypothetical protein